MAMPKKYLNEKYLKPDSKGRITIGNAAKNVSSYKARYNEDGTIILEPQVEIPASEAWLYQNKDALDAVKKGLQDAATGKVKSRGSFAQYVDDEK